PLTCTTCFRFGPGPIAASTQDRRTMRQTLAGEGDHSVLPATPVGQCAGPFLRPAEIGDLFARLDQGAVDGAGGCGAHLARDHRHHRLVERLDSRGHRAHADAGSADVVETEGVQVAVSACPVALHDARSDVYPVLVA